MGVMARDQGDVFVVTSDRTLGEAKNTHVAKKMSSTYLVWTGDCWSSVMADAKTFETAEAADDYIRANSDRVMKDGWTFQDLSASKKYLAQAGRI